MKCKLTIQEKLKDLRTEKGLSLEQLAEQTGLSKSALGSYESNDYKDISHTAITTLAEYYGVSGDYLLGLTENREHHSFPVDELGLDDATISLLKSGNLNVRLICEMIKHSEFINFLSDLEIYVDNLAGIQIRNMNKYIEQTRISLKEKQGISNADHYMKTLEASIINEDNYFGNLLGNDIRTIAEAIREAHKKDSDTGDSTTAVDDVLKAFEEVQKADNATQAQMLIYSKMFKINFTKMDPYEFKTFTDILQKYSDAFKIPKGNGRGKKK